MDIMGDRALLLRAKVWGCVQAAVAVIGVVCSAAVQADDTDLFRLSGTSIVPARLMLVVDTSSSMARIEGSNDRGAGHDGYANCPTDPGGFPGEAKICTVQRVLLQFLDPGQGTPDMVWPDDYHVGLARYGVPGAVIENPILQLGSIDDAGSQRNQLIQTIQGLRLESGTPLIGSYLEVAEYLTGGTAVAGASAYSDPSVWAEGGFDSYQYAGVDLGPQCGETNNHLIFLTDGGSSGEAATNLVLGGRSLGHRVYDFANDAEDANTYDEDCGSDSASNGVRRDAGEDINAPDYEENYWGCLSIIADRLYDHTDENGIENRVITHVVAYDMEREGDDTVDGMMAWRSEEGLFIPAANAADLSIAFGSINNTAIKPGAFVSATGGVGVNQVNRFSHMDEMYFSVFTPSKKPFWYGNLKKYFFQIDGEGSVGIYTNQAKTIAAVEDGSFLSGVRSEWSEFAQAYSNVVTEDGDQAHIGGAASQLRQPSTRNLFVSMNDNLYQLEPDDSSDLTEDFDIVRASLALDYAGFLGDPLGADAPLLATYVSEVVTPTLSWLVGEDVNAEWGRVMQELDDASAPFPDDRNSITNNVRNFYGAPLHSSPVLVNYLSRDNEGAVLDNPENVVFVSTNDGKLYAVDSDTGAEYLAYMPEVMLKRATQAEASPVERMFAATKEGAADGSLIYGLDSTWTVWRQDVDKNGNIDTGDSSFDFVYMYGGMRRGGRNYFILDATDVYGAQSISELAVLEGGVDEFTNNGQSWSEPQLAIIEYNGTPAVVFIIGGGYDEAYDAGRPTTLPALGAQLYVIAARAFTDSAGNTYAAGDVLWWASEDDSDSAGDGRHVQIAALQYSVPSTVKTIDRTGNGLTDHVYVGDMGGQILRLDFNHGNTGYANLVSNTSDAVVAQLGMSAESPTSTAFEEDRRFFYPPSAAIDRCPRGSCIVLAIGSGWRSNPTNAVVEEKFYYLIDYEPFGVAQAVLSEASTTEPGGSIPVIQHLTKVSDADSANSITVNPNVLGYSLELGGTGFDAEKLLGSPLIVGGVAYFSTYYRPPEGSQEDVCVAGEGASAFYSFEPGSTNAITLAVGQSQNAAGSLQALLTIVPGIAGGDGGDGDDNDNTPPTINGGIVSGTASVAKPPIPLDSIRKTQWQQVLQ